MATALLVGASVASAGLGLIGSFQQASATEAQGEFRAAVARNNAAIRAANAAEARRRADVEFENARREGFAAQEQAQRGDRAAAREIGRVRAAQGASGLTGGSQERTVDTLLREAGIDRVSTRRAGDSRASQFRARGQDFLLRGQTEENLAAQELANAQVTSELTEFNANNQRLSGIAGAVGSIARIGDKYSDYLFADSSPPQPSLLGGSRDIAKVKFNGPSTRLSLGVLQ